MKSFIVVATFAIVAIIGLAACTEPAQEVGTSQQGLTETPLQEFYCSYFSCAEGAPPFTSEDEEFYTTLQKENGGDPPKPEYIKYDGQSVSELMICLPPVKEENIPFPEPGKPCSVCYTRYCRIIRFYHIESYNEGQCFLGVVRQWGDEMYCYR